MDDGVTDSQRLFEQLEKELIQSLDNPQIRYLDLYVSNFDHVAHHNRDRQSQMIELQEMDVGRSHLDGDRKKFVSGRHSFCDGL